MLDYAYSNYGGYFWIVIVAVITYALMLVIKKSFLPITKKIATTEHGRRVANVALGIVFSVSVALVVGKFGNFLFGSTVHFKWFVAAGLLSNYAYLVYEKCKESNLSAFAKAFNDAIAESNLDITDDDLPLLTEKVKELVSAFKTSTNNKHAMMIKGIATNIAASVEITEEEKKEIEESIGSLKRAGYDVSSLERAYQTALADGKITADEKALLESAIASIRAVINR